MAKLEIPVVVDISGIESLIDEIKHLQTYKLSSKDEQILVDRDDVVKIFADHVRANIKPERKKGKWIYGESEAGNDGYYCSKCGNFVPWKYDEYDIDFIKEFLFCNKCGAEMEGQDARIHNAV